jgi:hypothetical protein
LILRTDGLRFRRACAENTFGIKHGFHPSKTLSRPQALTAHNSGQANEN